MGDFKITPTVIDTVDGDGTSFGSDTSEEHRSNMKSSFELHNEVGDNPTPVGCELENFKEEIMQRDVHNSNICISLCHNEERFDMNENPNPTITIVESYEASSTSR